MLIPNFFIGQTQLDSSNIVKSELDSPINYSSLDSIVMNMEHQKAYLYNNAHVDYGEIVLDACFIEFDFKTELLNL